MTLCIEWQKATTRDGYGLRWWHGRTRTAHRVAWIEANGEIPEGMQVLHRCDNPRCVNVEHLFLGTNADNMADRKAKGRYACKLTDGQVAEVRSSSKTNAALARKYGVDPSLISRIRSGAKR